MYVAPVVDKLNGTKEVYVDPVIIKAMDIKEKTTKVIFFVFDKNILDFAH